MYAFHFSFVSPIYQKIIPPVGGGGVILKIIHPRNFLQDDMEEKYKDDKYVLC